VRAAPGGEVNAQRRVPAGYGQPLARGASGQRPGDKQVPALVQPEVGQIGQLSGGHGVQGR